MDIFLSWRSTAHIEVDRATRANEPEAARKASSNLDTGNMLMQSWVLAAGGEMVTTQGTEGVAKVPAEKLDELPEILERYEQATDSRVSVGVGFEPQEADTALTVAEHRGGQPAVTLYSEDVAREAHELEESEGSEELGPIAPEDEALLEDEAPEADGGVEPTLQKAEGDAKPGEASKVVAGSKDPMAAAPTPVSPASPMPTPSASAAGGPPAGGAGQDPNQLKQAVAQVLQTVKQNMPAIQKLQQTDPAAFKSVTELVQAFIAVAEQLFGGGQPMQKSEDSFEQQVAEESGEHPTLPKKDIKTIVHDHMVKDEESGCACGTGKWEDRGQCEKSGCSCSCHESLVKEEPHLTHPPKPMEPGKRHDIVLPVGAQLDTGAQGTRNAGKVKVRHQDGKTTFVSVRAGQVLSQDGHAISSRNPGGR